MTSRSYACLKATKEFGGLGDDSVLKDLAAKLVEVNVTPSEILLHQGSPQEKMLIVGDSLKFIRTRGGTVIDEIPGPACVGLLHLFRGDPCFADIKVAPKNPLEDKASSFSVWSLSRDDLFSVLQQPSAALSVHLLAMLSQRLRTQSKWARAKMADDSGIKVIVFDAKSYDRDTFVPMIETLNQEAEDVQHILRFNWVPQRLTADTAPAAVGASVACIFVNDICDAGVLQQLAKYGVKMVALRCAGYNNVDLAAAEALGIAVVRVPAYSPYAVAEFAVGLVLTLNRKLHKAIPRTQQGNFALHGLTGFDLHGKTVGIVGTGKIGRCVISIFRGFGMKVLAYDAFPNEQCAKDMGFAYMPLDEMLPLCDIVSIHCPLLPATRHLINNDRLGKMKRGSLLINTSRGPIVDTNALVAHLKSGHLGGAGLDVYENEREYFFEDHSDAVLDDDMLALLTSMPNVLLTGHQAFLTQEALDQIARVTLESITELLWHGNKPTNVVTNEYAKL